MSRIDNPLDNPGQLFDLALMNPNPSSSKTKDGPVYRVSFEIDQETWLRFMDAETKGMMLAAKCTVVGDDVNHIEYEDVAEKDKKGSYGMYAAMLYRANWLIAPPVLTALGTDNDYLNWLKSQPCRYCGHKAYFDGERLIYNDPAHTRRIANGADTGRNPEFSAISLCHEHYALQRKKGESSIGDREWWDKQRLLQLIEWVKIRLYAEFGVTSLSEIPPAGLVGWATRHGIQQTLPRKIRESVGEKD